MLQMGERFPITQLDEGFIILILHPEGEGSEVYFRLRRQSL